MTKYRIKQIGEYSFIIQYKNNWFWGWFNYGKIKFRKKYTSVFSSFDAAEKTVLKLKQQNSEPKFKKVVLKYY
jgi:hypothetical protein